MERYELVIKSHAEFIHGKLNGLLFDEMLRRIGESCTITQWSGGAGTYG